MNDAVELDPEIVEDAEDMDGDGVAAMPIWGDEEGVNGVV